MYSTRSAYALLPTVAQCGARPAKRRCLSSSSTTRTTKNSVEPPYKILFFGADKFSCVTLETLYEARQDLIEHLVVVTPPDQRTGRRLKEVHRPPLRILAESLSIPSIALPPSLLKDWSPPPEFFPSSSSSSSSPLPNSLLLTASFGHLLPTSLLSLFLPLNALNLHPSMLPKYRGAAPIQWGVINGDSDRNWRGSREGELEGGMGVTVQELSRGKFDRGRILGQERVHVPEGADFLTLEPILARNGGQLLVKILRDLSSYQTNAKPQDPSLATSAPKLTKQTARIDWEKMTAMQITRLQRGVGHQYPLWTTIPSTTDAPTQLQLLLSPTPATLSLSDFSSPPPPGSLFFNPRDKAIYIATLSSTTKDGPVENEGKVEAVKVEKVKKEGGKWIDSKEWWNGIKRSALISVEGWVKVE
ncbi:methionyl-tRNA formyltransferase [Sporobolomyces salmoneus]|uniref:methionyl-tRNA formyltransferase n=1 Tax=Sporobolomyces salmoneus TaxID=183962 RepID=UPI00316C5B84